MCSKQFLQYPCCHGPRYIFNYPVTLLDAKFWALHLVAAGPAPSPCAQDTNSTGFAQPHALPAPGGWGGSRDDGARLWAPVQPPQTRWAQSLGIRPSRPGRWVWMCHRDPSARCSLESRRVQSPLEEPLPFSELWSETHNNQTLH